MFSSAVDYDTHNAEPEMSTLVEWISPEVINFFSNNCQINYIKVALIITVCSICHSSRSWLLHIFTYVMMKPHFKASHCVDKMHWMHIYPFDV